MACLRTDYCWIKYLRCTSKRASTWWGLSVSGPWISPGTRSNVGRAWASRRRNPCPARLVLSAWTRSSHCRTATVADWIACPLSATGADVVPPPIRSFWNLLQTTIVQLSKPSPFSYFPFQINLIKILYNIPIPFSNKDISAIVVDVVVAVLSLPKYINGFFFYVFSETNVTLQTHWLHSKIHFLIQ